MNFELPADSKTGAQTLKDFRALKQASDNLRQGILEDESLPHRDIEEDDYEPDIDDFQFQPSAPPPPQHADTDYQLIVPETNKATPTHQAATPTQQQI